ncbi:hypothetical protein HETIRDRAFT_437655 [Heterobasidion irregulare TC 32-1]|uniref:Uncharacterized protein n=1 Tax=Heterobasidion irregulare (strain TC 32-1) TaxID=747525 RepID=W4KML0_HETIT|nr:uncharacterized protein HETIRDRAFT_437655 [Heterobasidion irregulare TC 32-1]ETW86939.1 hypothetical protein HETIRDRAFT_437655 [Heterobasidion irregulare TC 32-1]
MAAAVDMRFWRYASVSIWCKGFLSSQKLDANSKQGVLGSCAHGVLWLSKDLLMRPRVVSSLLLRALKGDCAPADSSRMSLDAMNTAQSGMAVLAFRIRAAVGLGLRCRWGWGRDIVHLAL